MGKRKNNRKKNGKEENIKRRQNEKQVYERERKIIWNAKKKQ